MSSAKSGTDTQVLTTKFNIAKPHDLSPRNQWLRDYYFKGVKREWNNEYMSFSTGIKGDRVWAETDYYIVPEVYFYMGTKSWGVYGSSVNLMAQKIKLPEGFWEKSLPERRMIFFREVILNHIPQEIIGPELLAGGRFNTQLSKCLNEIEQKEFNKRNLVNRNATFEYHNFGFGNLGATGGHLIPDYASIIKNGFKSIYAQAKNTYEALSKTEQQGSKGAELRAMMMACEIPRDLAAKYAQECRHLKDKTQDFTRREELEQMAKNLDRIPWEPATTFYEAIQSLWLIHMLVMAEESYPGPGDSLGRFDQYLWPFYEKDVVKEKKITKQFAKEILGSFWFHCNTVYDAQIKVGNQGITSGFGQLITLSGIGKNGEDLTNEFTYTLLEVIDEWSPILEPKPNIRLHRNSPDKLMDKIVDMVTRSQGAPFLLNFDERSIEGMILEGIPREDAWDYGCVGCLENTMQGNDRSGTVNCNPNLASSIGLTLWNGKSLYYKGLHSAGKKKMMHRGMLIQKPKQFGPLTGDPENFTTWDEFWNAWVKQMQFLVKYTVDTYNITEQFRADFMPTPYLSTMVRNCVEKGLDVRNGGPEIRFITIEGVGYATLVDSLLAIKKYVYDEKKYTIAKVKEALMADYSGNKEYTIMQALFKNKAPKFGNDDKDADEIARKVMEVWSSETFKYKTPTDFQFRPGMLSWNYWAGEDAAFTPATPNGRNANTFLSNAICPTNGADINGPTANANSIGKALGGKTDSGQYINYLPNGASHTITFNPSLLKDKEAKEKFKAYLRGYIENGGSALQINILDPNMLRDAQINPQSYSNLLVRVTGYNAYFVAIGKELQDEIIARESHCF